MAHRKAGGTAQNLKDSKPKMLGVKLFGGQFARKGNIILRQRGTKWAPGNGVGIGKDKTLFALMDGLVNFKERKIKSFTGKPKKKTIVSIVSLDSKEK